MSADDPTLGGLLGPLPKQDGRRPDSGLPASDRSSTAARTVGAVADHRSAPPVPRLEQVREEIARRRALAEAATPGPWQGVRVLRMGGYSSVAVTQPTGGRFVLADSDREARMEDCHHIAAAADPLHVLAALTAADSTLDRHRPITWHGNDRPSCAAGNFHALWPCPEALQVLDLYAPEVPDA